jgi:hypothetical protein
MITIDIEVGGHLQLPQALLLGLLCTSDFVRALQKALVALLKPIPI